MAKVAWMEARVDETGYEKGRVKRREILEQAVAMFGDVGYRGTSLRELAGRCGLSHAGLLHHFPTKVALLQAVLQQRDAEDHVEPDIDTEPLAGLRRLVEVVEKNTRRRPVVELFTVLAAEATANDHPAHAYFVDRYRETLIGVTDAYLAAASAGRLRDGVDPLTAAHQLVAVMDGLQLQWLLDDGATDMAGIVRAHVDAQLTAALERRGLSSP